MIHIIKQKKGFAVANVAKNGELLKISETLSSKAACWKNIRAEARDCYGPVDVNVQDDTAKKIVVWISPYRGTKYKTHIPPKPAYKPGKNKKPAP